MYGALSCGVQPPSLLQVKQVREIGCVKKAVREVLRTSDPVVKYVVTYVVKYDDMSTSQL